MKTKPSRLQIKMWGLCTIIGIALIVLVLVDQKKNQERILEAKLQSQLQQEDSEKNEKIEKATEIYNELVSKIHLCSFTCWGDDEMVGYNKISLATTFERYVNEKLQVSLMNSFGEVIRSENLTIPSMKVSNMGASKEGMDEILVRAGVDEIEVGEWTIIPEDREPVNLTLRNVRSGSVLHFANQKYSRLGEVIISDIKGYFINSDDNYDEDHPIYAFVRNESGESIAVGQGTLIEIESATKHIGSVPILFFEENSANTVDSVETFVESLERFVERYAETGDESDSDSLKGKPYVLICTADEDSDVDEALKDAFGDRYIRNDTSVSDMTKEDLANLTEKIYEELVSQGCFDEMNREIEEATTRIKEL